ncbi:MAG: hypothetical protein US57_C0007G0025 [Candidatus Moranbacteria bacterium GW2011_GWC2_37_73]|nr:MAG: hypothetical protein UR95_C0004G0064 [Parcubacteria group bacterium GW2011_GWC1_36_108]KKQ00593.1 MAG: hypothetical protein US09_C0009G0014 [Candidatus Moranbacteria bacterium GW2011_GWD1_36_198]KKQ02024.1 MAG: hypothetical protein US10_C0006G0022 [Candidatus Moranbacteria bacterium GW2011_GWD2_36_198]KKQ39881.1 MAG: hypothetical protein US57_C0007G0025 [Candidatus Moranbacteria bacterium GW2011_GWC2_37_73]
MYGSRHALEGSQCGPDVRNTNIRRVSKETLAKFQHSFLLEALPRFKCFEFLSAPIHYYQFQCGEMSEWLKEHAWKAC